MTSPLALPAASARPEWTVLPSSAQHIGQRDAQQDAYGFSDFGDAAFIAHGGCLAVLADGMGGLANGAWASTHAVRVFIEAYQAKAVDESPDVALRRAMRVANTVVHEEALRLNLVDRMGSTLVAAVVRDQRLHWINAGDSRIYLFEAGHLRQLSRDHSYGEALRRQLDAGQISLREAREHPLRNALTSYMGRPGEVEVDGSQQPLRLSVGSWVLLCSDGLSGVLDEAEMAAELHGTPQAATERLLARTLAHRSPQQDNVTVVLLHLPEQGGVPLVASRSRAAYRPEPHTEAEPRARLGGLTQPAYLVVLGLSLLVAALALGLWQQLRSRMPLPPGQPGGLTEIRVTPNGPPPPAPAPPLPSTAAEILMAPKHPVPDTIAADAAHAPGERPASAVAATEKKPASGPGAPARAPTAPVQPGAGVRAMPADTPPTPKPPPQSARQEAARCDQLPDADAQAACLRLHGNH